MRTIHFIPGWIEKRRKKNNSLYKLYFLLCSNNSIYKLKMLNASESARFLVGFPKTLNLPNIKLILVIKFSFWDTIIKCKRILKCI